MKIAIINGPNLNFLGIREPDVYGSKTLEDVYASLKSEFEKIDFIFFQSNHEGELIDFLQKCYFEKVNGIVINPGAYAHTSIALADAIKSITIPCVEVHISDIQKREDFRKHSYTAAACVKVISGMGLEGYVLGVSYLQQTI